MLLVLVVLLYNQTEYLEVVCCRPIVYVQLL